ncbi:Meiotic nuclear division protein [Gracilaria domingensis]|nr:Meiotic nuclear division protein [Gracilaria domingensis]
MAPRKGLSFDEKRDRLMDLFAETAEFFTLKELEKIAPKRKGIVSQSVKEVLQSLVDDNMVNTDKCGVQTVFWCLPSEASQKRQVKLKHVKEQIEAKTKERAQLRREVEKLQVGREDTEERRNAFAELEKLEDKRKEFDQRLEHFAEFDPEEMERLKERTKAARECANRWVDNIFNCQSWAVNKFFMDKRDFNKQFGIPEELDYIEG